MQPCYARRQPAASQFLFVVFFRNIVCAATSQDVFLDVVPQVRARVKIRIIVGGDLIGNIFLKADGP